MAPLRRGALPAVLLAALSAPRAAGAEAELRLGVESALEYDDNVLVRSDNVQDDFLVRAGPRLELRDEQGELRYELRYFPSYEKFFSLSELDGWNQDAFARLTWRANDRTSFSLREQYVDSNRAVQALETGQPIDPTGEAAAVLGRRGFTQNIAGAEVNHQLTRSDLLALSAQNVLSENEPFAGLSVTEGDVTSVGLSWLHALSARDQAGVLLRYTNQTFTDLTQDSENTSDFYNPSLQWVHRFDPTWSFRVSGGPAWVRSEVPEPPTTFTDQPLYPVVQGAAARGPVLIDTCPQLADGTTILAAECAVVSETRLLPRGNNQGFVFREDLLETTDLGVIGDLPDRSGDGLTYFASAELTKDWRTLTATLRYLRDASTTASATGNVRDVVQGSLLWRPAERWKVGLIAAWEQREQTTTGVVFDRRALVPATAIIVDPTQPGGFGAVAIGQSSGLLAREVDRNVKNERYTIALNVTYAVTRRTSLFARMFWIDQRTVDDFFGERSATRFNVVLGVRYYLDPIHLPI